MAWRIGVDIGGTFTDVAVVDDASGRIGAAKTLTTPRDFTTGVLEALGSAMRTYTIAPGEVAARLGERGFAVWHGNYYALEVMKRLGLEDGAVRVGFVHYNTIEEVDRILDELARLE